MADPIIVTCAEDAWTQVATNITTAIIHKKITTPQYYHTYRLTGGTAPTDLSDGIVLVDQSVEYNHSAPIDIYIYAQGAAGSVRVDA